MKKSKSIKYAIQDFQDLYDSAMSITLYEYINASLFHDENEYDEGIKSLQNQIKYFEKNNKVYNFLVVHIVAVMENYLENILNEFNDKDREVSINLTKNYKYDYKITNNDIIGGPQQFAKKIINSVIFHNLKKVNILFKTALNLDILNIDGIDIKFIFSLIELRHGVVHQSSRVKDKHVIVRQLSFLKFLSITNKWLLNIDCLLMNGRLRERIPNLTNKFYDEAMSKIENDVLHPGLQKVIKENSRDIFNFDEKSNVKSSIIL
ncbi:MAG: hypothetical protein WBG46_12955 [Nonlabens sp.]